MKHTLSLCVVLSVAFALCGSVAAGFMEDNFDSDHEYFDGTTVDVSGTPWTGIFGTQYLDWMDANISDDSCLSVKVTTNVQTSIGGTEYAFPFLYTDVTGDFTTEMIFKNPIAETYIMHLLGIVDLAASNAYMAGAFPYGPAWGFWDYNAGFEAGARTYDAGIGPFVTNNLCYKIERVGNEFTAYSRFNSESNWYMFSQYTHPTTLPETLSVGLIIAENAETDWAYGYTYEFEYFRVIPIPEPGVFGALALGLLMLIRRK